MHGANRAKSIIRRHSTRLTSIEESRAICNSCIYSTTRLLRIRESRRVIQCPFLTPFRNRHHYTVFEAGKIAQDVLPARIFHAYSSISIGRSAILNGIFRVRKMLVLLSSFFPFVLCYVYMQEYRLTPAVHFFFYQRIYIEYLAFY